MSLPPTPSNPQASPSDAFSLLDPRIQKWIYQHGWSSLRDIQEHAIQELYTTGHDLLVCAATAGGKTEAAFLPIASQVAPTADNGVQVLALSPLKALINDQHRRLEDICGVVDVPVHRWHGDVPDGAKAKVRSHPSGVLLITPESLEALMMRRPDKIISMFGNLQYVVIDEFHAFLGTERGMQLMSLLARLETVATGPVRRVGLSATIGDLPAAAAVLRPSQPNNVAILQSSSKSRRLQLQLRAYEEHDGDMDAVNNVMATDMYPTFSADKHLLFCNSRAGVENFTDLLNQRVPGGKTQFFPHHGSLSKELRQHSEHVLKNQAHTSVVCTSTLELGIDVGQVKSVAQIGAPFSVAALRQRLGRSGRQDSEDSILRLFIKVPEADILAPLPLQLRFDLVQSIAIVKLLLDGWYEPPQTSFLHLSTATQQIMSMLYSSNGLSVPQIWQRLHGPDSPFNALDKPTFLRLLTALGQSDIIEQIPDKTILLGSKGERIASHYSFYAAFDSTEEYAIISGNTNIGSLPVDFPILVGQNILFAGQRWQVENVDADAKRIYVHSSPEGSAPMFASAPRNIHQQIAAMMRTVYEEEELYPWCDATALQMLQQARQAYEQANLARTPLVADGDDLLLVPFSGSVAMNTLYLMLLQLDIDCESDNHFLLLKNMDEDTLHNIINQQYGPPPVDADEDYQPPHQPDEQQLAANVANLYLDKHDWALSNTLRYQNYASSMIDLAGAHGIIDMLLMTEDEEPVDVQLLTPSVTEQP